MKAPLTGSGERGGGRSEQRGDGANKGRDLHCCRDNASSEQEGATSGVHRVGRREMSCKGFAEGGRRGRRR